MPGTWAKLAHSPNFAASTMLLLTDGTVMCQQSGGVNWSRLTPDASGNYVNGTWTPLAPMINTRLYYASAVLRDGRVLVCGGEYSDSGSETNRCELYDPVADAWTQVAPPAGWTNVGDAVSCVLPDGRLLMGYYNGVKTALFDPVAGTWSAGKDKESSASEETWTLLPDQTVVTVQCSKRPFAEKFVVALDKWVSAGKLPVDLVEASSLEIGPAILRPDGRLFCVGATSHTAIFTPPANPADPGTWVAGPDFPSIAGKTIGAKDAPACLLPNGHVLLVGGPVDGQSGSYLKPTYFFEFDGEHLVRVTDPPNSSGVPYQGRMLLLPTGQVLFAAETNDIYCYTPDGTAQNAWRPTIHTVPTVLAAGADYTLEGTQLNGLSQAVSYGDDAQMATNYPLVRLRNQATGRVFFCRTSGHSTMAVATRAALVTTNFRVPAGVPAGAAELTVVANGIASQPVSVLVQSAQWPRSFDLEAWQRLQGSLAEGPAWVWGPNGPLPVTAGGANLAEQATTARGMMLDAMRRLQALGAQAAQQRGAAAATVPPAVDLEATGHDNDDDHRA